MVAKKRSNNPYIRFMKRNGGKGYSSVELRSAYKKNPATTLKKKGASRKKPSRKVSRKKRVSRKKPSRKVSRKKRVSRKKASKKRSRKKASKKRSRKVSKKSSARGLEAQTLTQLRTKAKARGFKGYSTLNKADLIDRLRSGKKTAEPAFLWKSPKVRAPGKRTPNVYLMNSPKLTPPSVKKARAKARARVRAKAEEDKDVAGWAKELL